MAPDGQVRIQASGIRLDHSLLSLVSEGKAICPFAHPELFEPIFCRWSNAATVLRWIPSGIGAAPLDSAGTKGAGRGSRLRVTVLRFLGFLRF
jgi:hypothetical protein